MVNSELVVLIPDIPGKYGSPSFRDMLYRRFVLGSMGNGDHFLTRIHPDHALKLPLLYVLFYPAGERGYHQGLRLTSLHRGRSLFQQFIVDAWASTEDSDLDYLRFNQAKLRADRYTNAYSAILGNEAPENIGRIVLPSSFTGGDRFMQRLYQDSMAIVHHFGRPSLFITFTTNPDWEENC
jgi:helitron helicase-like protein